LGPKNSILSRLLILFATVLVLFGASACSTTGGGIQSPENPPSGASAIGSGQTIGEIIVALDAEQLPPDAIDLLERYELVRRLDGEIRESLRSGDGDLDVHVKVIGVRLRSNGTAIWWGFMAGGDWITVDVNVTQNGQSIKRFQTGTSTALGGMIFGGLTSRIDRMTNTLGKRIAEGV
jgi:hypothetical protein